MVPLSDIINKKILLNGFADGHNLNNIFKPNWEGTNEDVCVQELKLCMEGMTHWMSSMRLKLNPSKTKHIFFGHEKQLNKCKKQALEVGESYINHTD